ncbi:MAG: hypothetical protein HKO64_02670 [Xanthomonadales bacterium]|nr:hypothetical protein [Xanthomonadales bacterium]
MYHEVVILQRELDKLIADDEVCIATMPEGSTYHGMKKTEDGIVISYSTPDPDKLEISVGCTIPGKNYEKT